MKNFKSFWVFALLFLLTGTANAANYYWKTSGRADQNYTNSANWESAPGSGTPANGSLAPSSTDDVYFPAGNLAQTISVAAGATARDVNILASGVITFTGSLDVYGSFTSNANHQFGAFSITFLGTGNHTINMGNNASHSTGGAGYMYFNGLGTYTLVSDFNIPGKQIYFNSSTFISNGFEINSMTMFIQTTVGGSKTINLANSKVSITGGLSNQGGFVISALPATTTYNFTNTEININQTSANAYMAIVQNANGTVINGIKSITYTEATPGIASEHFRSSISTSFTIGVTDFNINTSAFNFTSGGKLNLNIGNLNLLKPVSITSNSVTQLSVNTINETASCLGQSSLRSEGATPITFNATVPIITSNIGFRGVTFTGSTVTMPLNNDLGLNTGTYTTTTAATSRSFYWVGGTGNWNDPTKWSLLGSGGVAQTATGCLPNYNDDVYFDAASFLASGQTVTIAGSGSAIAYARNVYWTDPSNEGRLIGGTFNINGSADFSGSSSVASVLKYVGTGSHTIKSGNTTYTSANMQFLGTGTYDLVDDLICSGTMLYLSAGNFNSNGKAITALFFKSNSFPALASNLRKLDISNSVLTLSVSFLGLASNAFDLNTVFLNSFNATGSTINITNTGNPVFSVNGWVNNSTVSLTSLAFNTINFTATTGTPTFTHSGVLNFSANTVNFASNATLSHHNPTGNSHAVNTYNLTPGKTYTFSQNSTFTVINAINSNSTGSCSPKVTIMGGTTARVNLYKAGLPFTIQNAIVRDINASGATLSVPGGEDLLNNLNVNITSNPSQNFYWVGGTGNWNDPTHWSIGVSGGNPAVINVNNCIPGLADDVFFDGNSFTAPSQTVTIDNTAYCRNMLWDNAVSAKTPIFAGVSGLTLNTYGTVTLAPNMTFPFSGTWLMKGNSLTTNANSITTNGVAINSLLMLNGGGRYDLLDNFKSTNSMQFTLGQFYTNTNNINALGLLLTVTGTNKADISSSVITLNGNIGTNTYIASHSSNANWNATGSTIFSNFRNVNITSTSLTPIIYGKFVMNAFVPSATITNTGTIKYTDLTWLKGVSGDSYMNGNMEIGNLTYFTSSNNSLASNKIITVTGKLTANGTPCSPIRFFSSSAGTPATLTSTLCNFDIKFARLTDITAGGSCTIAQNKVLGDDAGGNSNWTFATIASFEYLGADKVLKCNEYPYTLSTASFNQDATSILWSNGATTPTITVTGPGTYSVTVTYGTGCNLTDAITLGITPSPVLAATTLYACALSSGGTTGNFTLTDADAQVVATPADYTFSYHTTSADAIANINPLASPYNSISKSIYVRVLETATGCFSVRDVVLVVKPKVAPTVQANQKVCATVYTTIAAIKITGTNITWYADALTTTALPITTVLVNGTTYYATETIAGGCESDRVPVTVKLESCAIANPSLRSRGGN